VSGKGARARQPIGAFERPKAVARKTSRQDAHPFFCFRHIDKSTKQSYKFAPSPQEAKEILAFACEMAQLTWSAIEQQTTGGRNGHRKHHEQPVETIERCAQKDLTRRGLDELIGDAALFRFRLGGKKRLWGFRTGRVFHAIWWDTDHAVYKTEKK